MLEDTINHEEWLLETMAGIVAESRGINPAPEDVYTALGLNPETMALISPMMCFGRIYDLSSEGEKRSLLVQTELGRQHPDLIEEAVKTDYKRLLQILPPRSSRYKDISYYLTCNTCI